MHAMRGHVLKLSDQYPIRTGTDTDSAAGWWCAGIAGWEEAVHSNATLAGPATRSLHQGAAPSLKGASSRLPGAAKTCIAAANTISSVAHAAANVCASMMKALQSVRIEAALMFIRTVM